MWFRRDLRLDDNPAWSAATTECAQVVALFVLDVRLLDDAGPFRRRQLLANVAALDEELRERTGTGLTLRQGNPTEVVAEVVAEAAAGMVYLNADVSGFATRRDRAVTASLPDGVGVRSLHGTLVHPPGTVLTKNGALSKVFTPFWRAWAATPLDPWSAPGSAEVVSLASTGSLATDGEPPMVPGTAAALTRLEAFVAHADRYGDERDFPGVAGTSMLSADLKYGTLSPRTALEVVGESTPGRAAWCRQLAWRDWYAHLLVAHPSLEREPMSERYRDVVWADDPVGFEAWKQGRTGYPLVDAGMRELAATGWMHNRVRMVVASFLVKDLLIDWRLGEAHFRRLLVDGDTSQNVGNWQWSAGTGPDAAPYHRIMNPVLQSRKFDTDGTYIKHWVPELGGLPAAALHAPWDLPPLELAAAGVTLGESYPWPIVDHFEARQRFMAAFRIE
jgi:deoxyribodipyrimidine photo-lyase